MNNVFQHAYFKIGIYVLLLVLAIFVNTNNISIDKRPSDGYDEQMWTGASITSYAMYFKGHTREQSYPERWFLGYAQKYRYNPASMPPDQLQWFDDAMWTFGWKAPNIAKFAMGAGIWWTADTIVDPNGYFHVYSEDKSTNKWPGNYSPASFVERARLTNAFFNTAQIGVVLAIGYLFVGFYAGAIAALYLIANPTVTMINTAAGVDSAASFFSTLAILLIMLVVRLLYEGGRGRKLYYLSAATGLAFACAVGSKLSGATVGYLLVAVFLMLAYDWLVPVTTNPTPKKSQKASRNALTFSRLLLSGALITVVTFTVFIYTNPVLYQKPTLKIKMIRESVKEFFDIRAKALNTDDINKSASKSFGLVLKRNLVKTEETYYGTIGTWLPFKGNPLDLICVLLGVYYAFVVVRKAWKSQQRVLPELILLMAFTMVIYGVVSFIWVDWPRYHTPIYPMMALLIGYGLVNFGNKILEKWFKQQSKSLAP